MDQDQLTAAIVAGIVLIGGCLCVLWYMARPRETGLYDLQEDPQV